MSESILPERLRNQPQKRKTPARMRQLSLALFTVAVIAAIAYGAYYFFMPKQENFVLNFYTYASVGMQDFLETLTVKGTVIPQQVAVIAPKVGGTIEEVYVQEGQDVAAGEPLLRLYSAEIVQEKNQAETELSEARAKLAETGILQERELEAGRLKVLEAQERLAAAEKDLELHKLLYEYGTIPRIELERAEQAVEAAKRQVTQGEWELELLVRKHEADLAAIEKTIAINEEKVAKAQERIEQFLVRAEFDGRILSLKLPNNRVVAAHQELGELANLTRQVVELQVPPGQTERFGVGTPVTVSLGQAEYAGEVSYIAPQAKQGTDGPTVLVRVDFVEEVPQLRPNSSVTANIHLQVHADSLYLPRGAYLSSGQQLFVYVIDGKRAVKREVQFGLLQGNSVQILRGLELGERVIISSYDSFRHLDEIQILPEGGHAL
ncbi:MAG TPA: efflux RND transporter periplasmic adaptor subunit [Limnochordia bacterium]|nr:efflux RND transporter periplasmic adaptor subunit [Limnochordia bacterium]